MQFPGSSRFRVLDKLGEGGMGIVYDAYDETRDMRVALKTLRNLDPENLYRFKREFRALRDLSHPNIVTLYELISEGRDWFLTMEPVSGMDFIAHVRGHRKVAELNLPAVGSSQVSTVTETTRIIPNAGQWPLGAYHVNNANLARPQKPHGIAEVVDIERLRRALAQLAQALCALHSVGIVHCDLKPKNVSIAENGHLTLLDFGIVAEMGLRGELRNDDAIKGTPAFMAPEQAQGAAPSSATDWYAFGVMLYLALTGRLPFAGSSSQIIAAKQVCKPPLMSYFVADVPGDLERLCLDLLSSDSSSRPRDADVLAALGTAPLAPLIDTSGSESDVFVGRMHSLHELHQTYSDAAAGQAQWVVVQGPSGIGKSALAERFMAELLAKNPDLIVLSGRCHEHETMAYKAFDGIIDDLSHYLSSLTAAERGELMPAAASFIAQLFPVFDRAGLSESPESAREHNPYEVRHQAIDALRALLVRLAGSSPIVLRIEDLQWIDSDSVALARMLLRPPVPQRLLFITTMRRSEPALTSADENQLADTIATFRQHGILRVLTLGPLDDGEQRELMRVLCGDSQALIDSNHTLSRDAAGHPMLLTELARYLESAPRDADRMSSIRLEEVIWQRIAGLSEAQRTLVEQVAIAGAPTPLRVLAQACALSNHCRERTWSMLRIARLVRRVQRADDELWIDSYHDKVRESVIEHLSAKRTRLLHKNLADALQDWGKALPARVGRHYAAAEQTDEAARYLFAAAEDTAAQLAFDRAQELYSSIVELLEDSQDRKLEPILCRARLGLAECLRARDRHEDMLFHLDAAEGLAREHSLQHELATIHYLRGCIMYVRMEIDECRRQHQMAYALTHELGCPKLEARALAGLADSEYACGRFLLANRYYDQCVTLAQQHDLPGIEIPNRATRGYTWACKNNFAKALHDCTEAAAKAARLGLKQAELLVRIICLAEVLIAMDKLDSASNELIIGKRLMASLNLTRFEIYHLTCTGRVEYLQGKSQEASRLAIEAVDRARKSPTLGFVGPICFGVLAMVTRDPAVRHEALAEGKALLDAGSFSFNYLCFYREAMDATLAAGELETTLFYAQALEDYIQVEPFPWARFLIERARVLVRFRGGDRDPETRAAIARLIQEAKTAGLHKAAKALAATRSL